MRKALMLFVALSLLGTASMACSSTPAPSRVPVVGLPCENCDMVFEGMPSTIPSIARIAPAGEPGTPLRIDGTVRDAQGRAVAGVIVYAYHTDAKGLYPRHPTLRNVRHGRLRGWAKSDAKGHYRFDTIRPAGYPDTDIPQHVHMHLIEPACCTYWIDDIHFTDDPRLTAEQRRQMSHGRAGVGIVTPRKDASGRWLVTRDLVLGRNIPGYAEASKASSTR